MKPRIARGIAWSLVVVFIALATVGLTFQLITNTSYSNIGIPVLIIMLILAGVWPAIGAMIVSRHPRHPVGWLLCFGLLAGPMDMFAQGYVSFDTHALSGSLPGVGLALVWLKWSGFPFATTAFTLMILLFPDGRPPSSRWRQVGWTAVGALVLYLPLQALEPGPVDPFSGIFLLNPLGVSLSLWAFINPFKWIAFSLLVLCYTAAFISLIYRLRQARGDERQQIKWLVFPVGLYGFSIPLLLFGLAEANVLILGIGIALGLPAVAGIVIATAFAIFKYRLYDIDLLLNRTLVYGALTASVVGLYVLVVGALGTFFQSQGNLIIALLATGLVAVLFQPLRERLQRGVNRLIYGERDDPIEVLSRLGEEMETALPPDQVLSRLVETIAQTLKLPFVGIALKGQQVAAFGQQTENPLAFPLTVQGEATGELLAAPRSPDETFTEAEMRLLRNLARQAGTAVHAVQLMADLQRSRHQLVTAREEERLRLRRDLHDGLGPALASVVWQADSARDMVYTDPSEAVQLLDSSIEQAQDALADIRRLVYGLRPPALDELGLVGALEQAVRQHQQTVVTIEVPAPLPSLPAAVEVAAYRIVQEALKNAVEHGQAQNCAVRLALDGSLRLTIRDDGLGLPGAVTPGVGLVSMRERAEELGGAFTIHPRQAGGTRVEVSLPLELGG